MDSKLKVTKTTLDGVLQIMPPTIYEDHRGVYVELYNERIYADAGINIKFVAEDISLNYKDVLRGIHGDSKTWKLTTCTYGRVYSVIVNWDKDSPQFKRWESFVLSDSNRLQLLVPPNFGNSFLVLSDVAIYHYKQSAKYDRRNQFTIPWNDPTLGIWWPTKNPILSKRDTGPEVSNRE